MLTSLLAFKKHGASNEVAAHRITWLCKAAETLCVMFSSSNVLEILLHYNTFFVFSAIKKLCFFLFWMMVQIFFKS